jgi:hypothetical protein
MKTKYKYIYFRKSFELLHGQRTYGCINTKSGHKLGYVGWNANWRQYCYYPTAQAVYSAGCLDDISHFISQLS